MYKFVYLFSNIKRIIFQSMIKFNGQDTELVSPNQVKQIAGRAGRYGTVHDQGGLVTTLQRKDLEHLKRCMNTPNQNVVAAGLLPTSDHIVNLTHACPNLSLPSIFDLYLNHSSVGQSYFLCLFRDLKRLALILQEYRNIKIRDRFQLACAPVKTTDDYVIKGKEWLKEIDGKYNDPDISNKYLCAGISWKTQRFCLCTREKSNT